jgi:hypothetical protein
MNFTTFKDAVAKQFERMQKYPLFRTSVEKDKLWDTYLNSFPEGTNLIYRERREYDCNCCRQFVRAVGNVVAVINGQIETIWDISVKDEPAFQTVAYALAKLVRSHAIENKFLHSERTAGTDKNFEELVDGKVQQWNHFFVNIDRQFVVNGPDIASTLNGPKADHDVLLRSLSEVKTDALDVVLELIAQNSLYRGEEHKFAVSEFLKLKKEFSKLTTDTDRDVFAWTRIAGLAGSVARFRNTSIGTLVSDLSEGYDVDDAVKSFELKVAPANYKRPTALVTKAMIESAKLKIEELGLTSALERRYARLDDITINNILFANRDVRQVLTGSVFDELSATASTKFRDLAKIEEVPIAKFLADILPKAESLEVMLENQHSGNMVSLIAPVNPTAGRLFKWDNNFSWSYAGEVTDSIKEKVKKAGGNVTGDLGCRLAWFNHDDLDFHMKEPGGHEISFMNRGRASPCGGALDVDMNAGVGSTREPVENIVYPSQSRMKEGVYTLLVHQFRKRESDNVGFEVEIDFMGDVHHFAFDRAVPDGKLVIVAKFNYSKARGIEFLESLPSSKAVRTVWGLQTQNFHQVKTLMMSPNFWDEKAVGNKHYFFMLDGCVNDTTARGFYNEFLRDGLNEHRKVFEMVGSKMKVEDSTDQMSGLGFSSTQKNAIICRVKGSFTRLIKIVF